MKDISPGPPIVLNTVQKRNYACSIHDQISNLHHRFDPKASQSGELDVLVAESADFLLRHERSFHSAYARTCSPVYHQIYSVWITVRLQWLGYSHLFPFRSPHQKCSCSGTHARVQQFPAAADALSCRSLQIPARTELRRLQNWLQKTIVRTPEIIPLQHPRFT